MNASRRYIFDKASKIFVFVVPLLYLLNVLNMKIFDKFPRITIVTTILLFFACLLNIVSNLEKELVFTPSLFGKVISEISFYMSIFLIFWLSFTVSNKVLYYSTLLSISMSVVMVIFVLSTIISAQLATFDYSELERGTFSGLIKNIIFLIPCLLTDFLQRIKSEVSGLPSSTFMLISAIIVFIILFYIVPYIIAKLRRVNGVPLISPPKTLNREVLYLSQDQLNEKIIENKPIATRKMLKANNEFKNYLEDNSVENFDENIHILDKRLNFEKDGYDSLDDYEKELVKKAMEKEASIDDFSNVSDFKKYIKSLIQGGQDKQNPYLLNMIKEYNNNNSKFIHQKSSKLVEMINRSNNIKDPNYHYALSFWIYFDASLERPRDKESIGLIMTYSDNPKIYYDYDKGTVVTTIKECKLNPLYDSEQPNDREKFNCKDKVVYETKGILFQRWNLFVINFNYGTLDIFVNNNLVSSTDGVSPYIEKGFLQFGSSEDKLDNCGICGVSYHEKPLTLNHISDIYRNNERPCFADK